MELLNEKGPAGVLRANSSVKTEACWTCVKLGRTFTTEVAVRFAAPAVHRAAGTFTSTAVKVVVHIQHRRVVGRAKVGVGPIQVRDRRDGWGVTQTPAVIRAHGRLLS